LRCRKRSVAQFMQEAIVFLVRVQCCRKESSRSLSHLLMSFLFHFPVTGCQLSAAYQSINQSINQHELAMAPHIQSSGAPEIQ